MASSDNQDIQQELIEGEDNIMADEQNGDADPGTLESAFGEFSLKTELVGALIESAIEQPTDFQNECISQSLNGKDIICQAISGVGKTAAFMLSTIQLLQPADGEVSVVVLCSSKDIVFKVSKEFSKFCKYLPDIKVGTFYGGVSIKQHRASLKNEIPHIVVSTPGRLSQILREKLVSLDKIKTFVLAECNYMLQEVDIRKDVQKVFIQTPREKQVLMYSSSTLSEETKAVCRKFCQDPVELFVENSTDLFPGLQQYFVKLGESEKNQKLNDLLDTLEFNKVIIFVSKGARAMELNKLLSESNFPSTTFNPKMPVEKKMEVFEDSAKKIFVIIDPLVRGVHIEKLDIVINYDFPTQTEQYFQRASLAGRFGTKGLVISFATSPNDDEELAKVQATVNLTDLPDQIDVATYCNA